MRSRGESARRLKARPAARRTAYLNKAFRHDTVRPPLNAVLPYSHTLHPNASTLVSCTCMRGLLAALVPWGGGGAVGWCALRPACQRAPAPPPAALIVHPTATPRPVPSS